VLHRPYAEAGAITSSAALQLCKVNVAFLLTNVRTSNRNYVYGIVPNEGIGDLRDVGIGAGVALG
jgi:hypothetical protein